MLFQSKLYKLLLVNSFFFFFANGLTPIKLMHLPTISHHPERSGLIEHKRTEHPGSVKLEVGSSSQLFGILPTTLPSVQTFSSQLPREEIILLIQNRKSLTICKESKEFSEMLFGQSLVKYLYSMKNVVRTSNSSDLHSQRLASSH